MKKNKLAKYSSLIVTGVLIIALIILYFAFPDFQKEIDLLWEDIMNGDPKKISERIRSFGFWGVLALVLLIVIQMFLIIVPSWLPMIVAALAYGFVPSILISSTGVFLASTIGYTLGHGLRENALHKMISDGTFKKLKFWVKNYGFWSIVIFRVSPFLSNDAISFLAGSLKMNYIKFISATMLGIVPLATAIAFFAENIDRLKNGMYWIGGAGVVIYAIFIYFDYKKRKKDKS